MSSIKNLIVKIEDLVNEGVIGSIDEIAVEFPKSLWSIEDGKLTNENLILGRNRCESTKILNIAGASRVGNDGTVELKLSDYICPNREFRMSRPSYFVATPRSTSPVYLTTSYKYSEGEIIYKVYGWNSSGEAASNILFDFHCKIQGHIVIL